jgi:hypothetical protein
MNDVSDDQDLPDRAVTEYLAQTLDLSVEEFVQAFGAGWQPLPDDGVNLDSDPSGMGNIFGPWYVTGEPFQMTLRPRGDRVELGVPVGQWTGSHRVSWESHDRHTLDGTGPDLLQAAPPVVANLLKRRRSKFRYCRYCRQLTAPEQRSERDVCYGCSSTWQGVIY